MRKGGKILAEIMDLLGTKVVPGMVTQEIDDYAVALCKKNKVKPAFKGYNDYPATICIGIDDIAIHGMPDKQTVLEEGQTVSIDMGIVYEDMYLDHAKTFAVGKINEEAEKFLAVSKLALKAAIAQAVEGNTTGDIGYAMEQVAVMGGYSVITVMTGHGIGKKLHEDPAIPCFGIRGKGDKLKAGMTLAIEAMINEGSPDLIFEDDGWTTRTADGRRSALYEHTVLVKKGPAEILTIK